MEVGLSGTVGFFYFNPGSVNYLFQAKEMAVNTQTSTKTVKLSIAFLVMFAVVSISLRIMMRSEGGLPAGDSAWSISISHQIKTLDEDAVVFLPPPWDTRHARLYSQSLSHPGLRQRRTKSDLKDRDIALTAPRVGQYTIESLFSIYVSHLPLSEPRSSTLTENNRASWLTSSKGIEVNTSTTDIIVGGLAHNTSDTEHLIESLFNFVSNNIRIAPGKSSASEDALSSKRASALGSTRALVALLRSAHLPARIVTGVDLQASSQLPRYWAEVYLSLIHI